MLGYMFWCESVFANYPCTDSRFPTVFFFGYHLEFLQVFPPWCSCAQGCCVCSALPYITQYWRIVAIFVTIETVAQDPPEVWCGRPFHWTAITLVSSAKSTAKLKMMSGRLLMNTMNSNGPRTLPCGMPLSTSIQLQGHISFTTTRCLPPVRKCLDPL